MRKWHQFFWAGGFAALIVLGFSTSSYAVLAYLDSSKSYHAASRDYQLGYDAGAVDMLRALQDAGKIGPPDFNAQALAIINCVAKSTDSQIDTMYADYIKKYPDRADRGVASAIYNAMRVACNIN